MTVVSTGAERFKNNVESVPEFDVISLVNMPVRVNGELELRYMTNDNKRYFCPFEVDGEICPHGNDCGFERFCPFTTVRENT